MKFLLIQRLSPGHLTYGEYFIPGETSEEVLISAHVCHPSLANDNLSGISRFNFFSQTPSTRKSHGIPTDFCSYRER